MKVPPKIQQPPLVKVQEAHVPKQSSFVEDTHDKVPVSAFEVSHEAPALGASAQPTNTPRLAQLQLRESGQQVLFAKAVAAAIIPGTQAAGIENALSAEDPNELMALLQKRFLSAQSKALSTPLPAKENVLGVQFVDVGRLVPGQLRISIERVKEKVVLQATLDGFEKTSEGVEPSFDEGRSTVPLHLYKPVVKMPGGQFLVIDGNHQVSAALLAGAQSVPCEVVADLSHLDEAAFYQEAETKGWTYLRDFGGADSVQAPSYGTLQNDPFRFLLTQTALKARLSEGTLAYEGTPDVAEKAWVKLKGKTADFVEFKLADALYRVTEKDSSLSQKLDNASPKEKAALVRELLQAAEARGEIDSKALGILWTDVTKLEETITATLRA